MHEEALIQPNQPWTNGQVERMNRTIKDAIEPSCKIAPYIGVIGVQE